MNYILFCQMGFVQPTTYSSKELKRKQQIPQSSSRIRFGWPFNILKFCVFVLNPFLQPSHDCLNWRNLLAIIHKDICGQRAQLALCLLITSLDLLGGRESKAGGLTGSGSSARKTQIPLQEDKPVSQTVFLNTTTAQE